LPKHYVTKWNVEEQRWEREHHREARRAHGLDVCIVSSGKSREGFITTTKSDKSAADAGKLPGFRMIVQAETVLGEIRRDFPSSRSSADSASPEIPRDGYATDPMRCG